MEKDNSTNADNDTPEISISDDNVAAQPQDEAIPADVVEEVPTSENALSPEQAKQLADVESQSPTGTDESVSTTPIPEQPLVAAKPKGRLRRWLGTKKGKVITALLLIAAIIGVLAAVPLTRYAIAGLLLKKDVAVVVIDSQTKKPVTDAEVSLQAVSAKTDAEGKATLAGIPVGEYTLKVTKKYYQDSSSAYTVPILASPAEARPELVATGRQVTVSVTNKISGASLGDATIAASDTTATTDAEGVATIVLPADKETVQATVKRSGYNDATVELRVVEQSDDNKLALTPAGSVYYLSKKTGKINVAKANLDGSDEKVIVEGTGKEDDFNTVLIGSRDWKYLALLSRRDGGTDPKLFVIDTTTGQMKVADEGKATFTLIGWTGNQFVYTVERGTANFWDDKRRALKAYDAGSGKLTVVDETAGSGTSFYDYMHQQLLYVRVIGDEIVYSKYWNYSVNYDGTPTIADKKAQLVSVKAGTADKKVIREFDPLYFGSLEVATYRPNELYIRWSNGTQSSYYAYKDSSLKDLSGVTDASYYDNINRNYLVSPNGNKTYWSEVRNGKNVHLVGDKNGESGVEMLVSEEFAPYGWYADDYVLLAKGNNELFIAAVGEKAFTTPLRITDYHKPVVTHAGYGYGYGGN